MRSPVTPSSRVRLHQSVDEGAVQQHGRGEPRGGWKRHYYGAVMAPVAESQKWLI
jgi:hypothetical protein